jgi:peptide/nickel transport system substrate-binding protein
MRLVRAGVACLAATLALAACTGHGGAKSPQAGGAAGGGQHRGGTLYLNSFRAFTHLDPQQNYFGDAMAFESRTIARTLTTFPAVEGNGSTTVVPDAATDTGTRTADAKTWTFTLKPDVKWQDGKPVTCADFKYGVSRTFAQDIINSGPTYALDYLDVPRDAAGEADYNGPYKKKGQAGFDKAIQCPAPNKIVFHLRHPVADFYQTVTLPAFAAVRQDKDTGSKYDSAVFSDGPYMIEGNWDPRRGGTMVRNPNWVPSSDSVRKAYPDRIVTTFGDTADTIYQKLESDNGNQKNTVTTTGAPPAAVPTVLGASMRSRSATVDNGYVDYLSVNVRKIPSKQVRQALAMAIDRTAYVTAYGGSAAGSPANSLISPLLRAYTKYDPFGVGDKGNPEKAKAVLQAAGVALPYAITYDYSKDNTSDKAAINIKSELEKAGFKVTLNGLNPDTYYDVIANPQQATALSFSKWGADWPSGSTVIPPLLDGRAHISADSYGNDASAYNDPTTNKAIDAALKLTDNAAQQQAWTALDEQIVKQGVVIPMMADRWLYLYGSNVKGYLLNAAFGGFVDLAVTAVQ